MPAPAGPTPVAVSAPPANQETLAQRAAQAALATENAERAAAAAAAAQQARETPGELRAIQAGLSEVAVRRIRVDGLALMRIAKHASETLANAPQVNQNLQGSGQPTGAAAFTPAVGQLLGLDSPDGALEVSNVVPLPSGSLGGPDGSASDGTSASATSGDSRGARAAHKYTSQILPRLADLNADANTVGFYVSTTHAQALAMPGFVDALASAQLSGGGIGASASTAPKRTVGGSSSASAAAASAPRSANAAGKGVAIVFDIAAMAQGQVDIKAYRLSSAFMAAYRAGKFDTATLTENELAPSNILEEVPVSVRSNALLTAFLSTLVTPSSSFSSSTNAAPSARATPLPADARYDPLGVSAGVSAHAAPAALAGALEHHAQLSSTYAFQVRQLARDRARLESGPAGAALARRRADNEQRQKDGLPLLPAASSEEAQLERLMRAEPSKLDVMCAVAAVKGASEAVSHAEALEIARAYGAKAGVVE